MEVEVLDGDGIETSFRVLTLHVETAEDRLTLSRLVYPYRDRGYCLTFGATAVGAEGLLSVELLLARPPSGLKHWRVGEDDPVAAPYTACGHPCSDVAWEASGHSWSIPALMPNSFHEWLTCGQCLAAYWAHMADRKVGVPIIGLRHWRVFGDTPGEAPWTACGHPITAAWEDEGHRWATPVWDSSAFFAWLTCAACLAAYRVHVAAQLQEVSAPCPGVLYY